jgi:hypothetical protein
MTDLPDAVAAAMADNFEDAEAAATARYAVCLKRMIHTAQQLLDCLTKVPGQYTDPTLRALPALRQLMQDRINTAKDLLKG